MLQFFRTYQRFFFIIVTVVIVISFSFFGTFSSLSQTSALPDRVVVTGVEGSPIMHRDLQALCELIAFSSVDRVDRQHQRLNLFNDSVIEKELMATGIGMMLAR